MKKILAFTLTAVLCLGMLTACGDKAPASSGTTPPAASESTPPEPVYNPNPLTGLENKGEYPEGKRFAAVMVNNISNNAHHNARPQWGLSSADVLVEIKVEGGITRFMGLFSDYKNMPQVGPVRSARDQFFQLILPFQPLYVHIGESTVQSEFKRDFAYGDLDINLDKYGFKQDPARKSTGVAIEHTAYTTGEQIASIVDKNNIDDNRNYKSPIFDFVNYNEPERVLNGDDAVKVNIVHSQAYRTYFNYDAATTKYMMSQYSMQKNAVHETIDANNNQQLGFDNVVVLFADIHRHPNYVNETYDIQQVSYNLGGVGYYFCNGKAEKIRWRKDAPQSVLQLMDGDGNETPIQLNPGKTYLSVVSLGEEAEQFSYDTGIGGDGAASESVVIDPSKVDQNVVDN